jgi:hypothetical protein
VKQLQCLLTPDKLDFSTLLRSVFDNPSWKGICGVQDRKNSRSVKTMAGILDIKQSALNRMQEKHANNYVTKPVAFWFLLGLSSQGYPCQETFPQLVCLKAEEGFSGWA